MKHRERFWLRASVFILYSELWQLVAVSGQLSLHFVSEPRSWEDARSYCREKYSDLATPDSMEEMSRLLQSVEPKYQGDVWIGLKGGARPRWLWSGNATLQYTHWQSEHRSRRYILIEKVANWLEAQSYCRENYEDLAIIESQEDQEHVLNLTEGRNVWIGLFNDSWEWVGQGNSSFRYWASETEMDSNGNDCVAVRTSEGGRWYRHACSVTHPFVCLGQQTVIKRQFWRLTLSAKEGVDLNNPNVNAAILEQIQAKLKKHAVSGDIKLQLLEEDGKVFTTKEKRRGKKDAD